MDPHTPSQLRLPGNTDVHREVAEHRTWSRSTSPDACHAPQTSVAGPSAWGFRPHWLLAMLLAVPVAATLFWWLGTSFLGSGLTLLQFHQFAVIIAAVTGGGYQLYFWVQRNNCHRPARCLETALDRMIPFRPRWIWVYSLFHYVMLGVTVVSIRSPADGVSLVFGGMAVLVAGCAIFYFFPTEVPDSFRAFTVGTLSARYLAFIQSMDNSRNAFPSMHCAIAAYVGLTVATVPHVGPWVGYGYIVLTALSCLFVKQHVIVDTAAGVALGAGIYRMNEWLAAGIH